MIDKRKEEEQKGQKKNTGENKKNKLAMDTQKRRKVRKARNE